MQKEIETRLHPRSRYHPLLLRPRSRNSCAVVRASAVGKFAPAAPPKPACRSSAIRNSRTPAPRCPRRNRRPPPPATPRPPLARKPTLPRESPHVRAAASSHNGILLKHHTIFRANQGDSMSNRTVASSSASDQYALAAELISDDKAAGLIGGYCEDGFPFYYANDAMVAMLGYDSVDDLVAGIKGMVSNTIHPADMVQVERDLGSEYYEGMTYETMYRMPRKDGTWFWTIDRGKVVRAEDGRLAIISMCSNLSDYVGRYTQMERHYEWSTLTLDNMP